jgi:hypothetical protein
LSLKFSKLGNNISLLSFINAHAVWSCLNIGLQFLDNVFDFTFNIVGFGPSFDVVFLIELLAEFLKVLSSIVNLVLDVILFCPALDLLVNMFLLVESNPLACEFFDFTINFSMF